MATNSCSIVGGEQPGNLKLSMSHAQMNRIGWRELAHSQTYSSSDVYGDAVHEEEARRADSEWRMAKQRREFEFYV